VFNGRPGALEYDIPDDALKKIADFLPIQDQNELSASSRAMYGLFREKRSEQIVAKLLLHVARGEEVNVKMLLQRFPEYILARGDVIDNSGRYFSNITVFQYAVWALDSQMWKMILDCLPRDGKREVIKAGLWTQYEEVTTIGINYTLDGVEIRGERHFNFIPLISAYKTYVEQFDSWSWLQRNQYWCKVIGTAQHLSLAHIAQECCRTDEAFYPKPWFKKKTLPRSSKIYFLTGEDGDWWPTGFVTKKLGVDFAILRAEAKKPFGICCAHDERGGKGVLAEKAALDLDAISALHKARVADVGELRRRLHLLQKPSEGAGYSCVVS